MNLKKIEVNNLYFSYDHNHNVLDDVSFHVTENSYTTIIGHNGSGKSTIAKLLIGLLETKTGDILIDNVKLEEATMYDIREKIGIVFQNPDNQFIGSTVADDIAFGLENHQVNPADMQAIIDQFSTFVGMHDFLHSEPTSLSGGQKQRVAIAGVLAMKPDILILDEATSMLDPKGKEEINQLIRNIHHQENLTIISITHDMEEVAQSDYVIVMDQGKVVMDGAPKDIMVKTKQLAKLQLDVPFAMKIKQKLATHGIEIHESLNIEKVVEELCQLRLKK